MHSRLFHFLKNELFMYCSTLFPLKPFFWIMVPLFEVNFYWLFPFFFFFTFFWTTDTSFFHFYRIYSRTSRIWKNKSKKLTFIDVFKYLILSFTMSWNTNNMINSHFETNYLTRVKIELISSCLKFIDLYASIYDT